MTDKERMLQGKLYLCTGPELRKEHMNAKRLTRLLNATLETEWDRRRELVQELFASAGAGSYIEPPFHCDYGIHTTVGKNFYANYNCCILDVCSVHIGDDVMFAPHVGIYAACHPIDSEVRRTGLECGAPITIGDRVWIGGHTCVCPGVTIGSDVVIGAGSVVTRDIPDHVVAAGNPCRVLRPITEEDRRFWQAQREEYEAEMGTLL